MEDKEPKGGQQTGPSTKWEAEGRVWWSKAGLSG